MEHSTPQKIDAHHHFWKYDPVEYGWISDEMHMIRRDFLPSDLEETIQKSGVSGVVSVQARQKIEETQWLLDFAAQHPFILGVVGWVPLISATVAKDLERFAEHSKFKAVRHVLHDEPDDNYMLREDFNSGISLFKSMNLTYDILIFEKHLPQTLRFVDRHPNQLFVVDHIAKPRIRESLFSPWRENLQELARREHVYCKLSGVVTEADFKTWTESEIEPYLETTLEAFGPERLMFGSDWPVCLAAADSYAQWVDIVSRFMAQLSEAEQRRIWSETAKEAYRLMVWHKQKF
jgi:L-fuconolactonase